jgi:hypothetical protein
MDDDDRSLDRLIRAAGGGFDPSPDLPERIGQRVRQRQARRRMAVSLGAVMVVAAIVGGGLKLAAQDGPGDELRTASDDQITRRPSSTSTTTPSTTTSDSTPKDSSSTTTSAPPTTMVPEDGSPTIYALRDSPDGPQDTVKLVEIDLATGEVLRDVIPLEGMTQVESSGDEAWWVRRDAQPCGNFTWEEYHPAGAGGLTVPAAVDFTMSPTGEFAAYVQADPANCAAPRRLVVKDMSTFADVTLEVPAGSGQLVWRADGSALAFSTDDPDALTSDGAIVSVDVTHEILAAGTLASSPLVESDDECFVGNPSFGPDGRLWYTKACAGSLRLAATGTGSEEPIDIELPTTNPQWIRTLSVNRRTGQVAFVADDKAWVLDGDVPRPFLGESAAPVDISGLLWPDR